MTLPYDWRPLNVTSPYRRSRLTVGEVIAYEHHAYEVVEVVATSRANWTDADVEKVNTLRYEPPYHVTTTTLTGPEKGKRRPFRIPSGCVIDTYPDRHLPICLDCGEVLPCRDQMAERLAKQAARRSTRYETAGVCPACEEPVSTRQKALTWPDNAVIPGGPPVTFHLRRRCHTSAVEYEKRWVKADPERRQAVLSCPGSVTNHNDGTYECTEYDACPGPVARHQSLARCLCVDCHARGPFDCFPTPDARLIDRRIP